MFPLRPHEGDDDFGHDQNQDQEFHQLRPAGRAFIVQSRIRVAYDRELALHRCVDRGHAKQLQRGGIDASEVDVLGHLQRIVHAFGQLRDFRDQRVKAARQIGEPA